MVRQLYTLLLCAASCTIAVYANFAKADKAQIIEQIWSPRFKTYSTDDGMSQSFVTTMIQGPKGYMWLATPSGVDRFDGFSFEKIKFQQAKNDTSQNKQIEFMATVNNQLLTVDHFGNVFAHLQQPDLFRQIYEEKEFHQMLSSQMIDANKMLTLFENGIRLLQIPIQGKPAKLTIPFPQKRISGHPYAMIMASDSLLWIATTDSVIYQIDIETGKFISEFSLPVQPEFTAGNIILATNADNPREPFIALRSGEIYRFDPANNRPVLLGKIPFNQHRQTKLNSLIYFEGTLWAGSMGDGLWKLNVQTGTYKQYMYTKDKEGSISSNNTYELYVDNDKNLWVSCPNGLDVASIGNKIFYQIGGNYAYTQELNISAVYDIFEDSSHRYWFSSHDAGSTMLDFSSIHEGKNKSANSKNKFNVFSEQKLHPQSQLTPYSFKNFEFTMAVREPWKRELWVRALPNNYRLNSRTLEQLELHAFDKISDKHTQLYADNDVAVFRNKSDSVVFIDKNNAITTFQLPTNHNKAIIKILKTARNKFLLLFSDSETYIEINTSTNVLNTATFNLTNEIKSPLISDAVISARNKILIGTFNSGILRLDIASNTLKESAFNRFLPDKLIYSMLVDNKNGLWVSSNSGISRIELDSKRVTSYFHSDGLQSNEFNGPSGLKDSYGLLFFGGINGVTVVDPEASYNYSHDPATFVDGMFLSANKDTAEAFRSFDPSQALPYSRNSLKIRITAIDFRNADDDYFYYRIKKESEQQRWVNLGKQRNIYLVDLPYGDYKVDAKTCKGPVICNSVPTSFEFTILPPFWLSRLAYFLYISLFLSSVYFIYRYYNRRIKVQQELANQERKIAEELRELNTLKDQFLANTSHELRTPLNGIIGLSEILKSEFKTMSEEESVELLNAIFNSGTQLQTLVSDLLDFSRLQRNKMILNFSNFDLVSLVKEIFVILTPQAKEKQLSLTLIADENVFVHADIDRIRQVLYNLISNAIKFSDTGTITLVIEQDTKIKVSVIDQGEGISEENLGKIFVSFTQVDGSNTRQKGGLGLGLAIAADIIELHASTISVSSKLGEGTIFSFYLEPGTR